MTKALARKNIYALLASIFLQSPDLTFTRTMLNLNLKEEECRFYEVNSDIFLGVNLIQNYISLNTVVPLAKIQEELAVDKMSLARNFNEDILNDLDNIGLELNFMTELCAEEVLALSQDHSPDTIFECALLHLLQKEFLQNHISKWVPAFANKLIEQATTDFIKGGGYLL